MPRCVCYAALRRKTRVSWSKFNILWRDKFSKDLIRMNKRDLRAATQILTGHACLNYHLSKLNRSVQPLCPLCEAEYDTVPHLLAQCPMLWQLRVEFFDTHYTTVTDIVDRYNLRGLLCLTLRPSPRQLLASSCEQIHLGSERNLIPSAGLLEVHPSSSSSSLAT